MWNTDGDIARHICADDFRIHFAVTERDGSTPADDIRTADDFAKFLEWWHEQNPGVVFTRIADAIDGDHGRLLWDVDTDGNGDPRLPHRANHPARDPRRGSAAP